MKIFFSLTRTVEDEEHGTTSTLQVVLFSAALGCEATFSLATGAPSRAHAGLGGHAASGWWSPPVTLTHHSASHDASRTSRTPVVAPHVPTFVSSTAGLSFTHRPRLLLLHIQTHFTSEHDGLQEEEQKGHYGRNQDLIFPRQFHDPHHSLVCTQVCFIYESNLMHHTGLI